MKNLKGTIQPKIIYLMALVCLFNLFQKQSSAINILGKNATKSETSSCYSIDRSRPEWPSQTTVADQQVNNNSGTVNEFFLTHHFLHSNSTRIDLHFNVNKTAPLKIQVIDLMGRTVFYFPKRTYEPGTYKLPWNGQKQSGKKLQPGIYFFSISNDNFKSVKKGVLP